MPKTLKNTSIYWMSRPGLWWRKSTKRWVRGFYGGLSSHKSFKSEKVFIKEWKKYPDAECYEWRFDKLGKRRFYDLELKKRSKSIRWEYCSI